MNLSEARVVGASTLAAAAVAFVTVVVYEGHCTVHSAGQTVNVEPGGTVEVHPGQPPGPPPPTVAGDPAQVDRLQKRVDELEQQLAILQDVKPGALPPAPPPAPQPTLQVPSSDENLIPPSAGGLDRVMISNAMKAISPLIVTCSSHASGSGLVKAHVRVAPDGSVSGVEITQEPSHALGACVASAIHTAKFPATKVGGSFSYPFMIRPPGDELLTPKGTATVGCDGDKLEDAARNDEAIGQHGAALQKMEQAIACKPTDRRYALAFMSACNAAMPEKAKAFFHHVPIANRHTLSQMCVRQNISEDYLAGTDSSQGYAVLTTKPAGARVFVDGRDTALVTPVTGKDLPLDAGKHKITFQLDKDRYTYPITVGAGESVTLSKDLQ